MKSKILSLTLAVFMTITAFTGCSSANNDIAISDAEKPASIDADSKADTNNGSIVRTSVIQENFKDNDLDSSWSDSTATQIKLDGTTATVSGSGASVSGGTVTITQAGTYVVSGMLSKGQILIDAEKNDLVRLVLNGVDITAGESAAIYAASADKLVLILADGTVNTITDMASYTYADAEKEEPNAAVFSKCDLSINGTGSLTVNGNYNHGIATKDNLVIASGNITVNSVNSAIRGKDSVTILDGTFNLTSKAGDGIKAANDTDTDTDKGWVLISGGTFDITAYNDGIQAFTTLQIDDGMFNITAGGGWPDGSLKRGSHARTNDGVVAAANPSDGSYKGLKSTGNLVINGGELVISAYDDSVHANGDITINGGNLTAQSGDDGIHADGTVTINEGVIDIKNSYEGIEGAYINLIGGEISAYSTDDGINVNSSSGLLTISGADIYINSGGDGIDSNGSVVMTGGTVYVDGPTASQDGGIDYAGRFTISGGTLVAASLQDNVAPGTESEQPSVMLYYSSTQKAGTEISVKAADGTLVVSYAPQKDYSSVVISAPGLEVGETYAIYAGSTKLCDVTLSSNVTAISDSGTAVTGGMGGMGGMGGPGGKGGRQKPNDGNMPGRPDDDNGF